MFILVGEKQLDHYKEFIIRADQKLHEQIAEEVMARLPDHKAIHILDLGAGQGALSQRLHDAGYTITAVDENPDDFRSKDVHFHHIDFNKSTQVAEFCEKHVNHFDAVLGIEVIEHVENPWEYVRLMKSILKPGGFIFLSTPNVTSWLSRLTFLIRGQFHQFYDVDLSYGHIAPITEWELKMILRREGFTNISVKPGGTLPLIWLRKSIKWMIFNGIGLLLRPFMRKGTKEGWCLIFSAQKE